MGLMQTVGKLALGSPGNALRLGVARTAGWVQDADLRPSIAALRHWALGGQSKRGSCHWWVVVLPAALGSPSCRAQQCLAAHNSTGCEQLGFLPGKKSSSCLPQGPFNTSHMLSPCPG